MLHTNTKNIKNQFERYSKSTTYNLQDCYTNFSHRKNMAMKYCIDLMEKYNGYGLKIIGYNSQCFSVGFIANIPDEKTGEIKKAFCYITRDYDRYIFMDEI